MTPFGFSGEATLQASSNFMPISDPSILFAKNFTGADDKLYPNIAVGIATRDPTTGTLSLLTNGTHYNVAPPII